MFETARSPTRRFRRRQSVPINVRQTKADLVIARTIARNTAPVPEEVAHALTWGADEKFLLVLAAAGWLASRGCREPVRRAGDHALLVTVAASLAPHAMKTLFDQTRPDRRTIVGHIHGVSFSGKREDSFPSGHALHMGALASAAATLPAGPRRAIRALAVGLSLTCFVCSRTGQATSWPDLRSERSLERFLRVWTGYPLEISKEKGDADI